MDFRFSSKSYTYSTQSNIDLQEQLSLVLRFSLKVLYLLNTTDQESLKNTYLLTPDSPSKSYTLYIQDINNQKQSEYF
jgi:hypothetical protein